MTIRVLPLNFKKFRKKAKLAEAPAMHTFMSLRPRVAYGDFAQRLPISSMVGISQSCFDKVYRDQNITGKVTSDCVSKKN